MKTLRVVFLAMLAAASAAAQAPTIQTTITNLTGGSVYLMSPTVGSGTVKSISCTVTQAVTGTPVIDIFGSVDGVTTPYYSVYGASNTWGNAFLPLQTFGSTSNSGSNVGDTFTIPLNIEYVGGAMFELYIITSASSGTLVCSSIYSS